VVRHAPSDRTLALRAEEVTPDLGHLPSVLLDLPAGHPYEPAILREAGDRLRERDPGSLSAPPSRPARTAAAGLVLAAAGGVLVVAGGPTAAWSAWGTGVEGADRGGAAAGGAIPGLAAAAPEVDLLVGLTVRVEPPAYTGLEPHEAPLDEGIRALEGSRIEVRGPADPPRPLPRARLVRGGAEEAGGGGGPAVRQGEDPGRWTAAWVLSGADRGLLLSASRDGTERERVIPVEPVPDPPPDVDLLDPARDMVLATGSGEVRFRARAHDRFGIDAFRLEWVHTRGSGESFDFREGGAEWAEVRSTEEGVEGVLVLSLDELGLGPGDVLHLRAVATDRNDATGPGRGVSGTRQIRVVREGDEMQVDALVGFPLEAELEPVLSQRMILLMTEDLLERVPGLSRDEFRRESIAIAEEQGRLRAEVGEQVYSRATGAIRSEATHLGTPGSGHTHGDGGHAHDGAGAVAAGAGSQPPTSRYGVASIFDPSVPERATAEPPALLPRGDPDEAGTRVGDHVLTDVGDPFRMPVGFGVLEDTGHDHDGDPILSVNRAMLAIHDHMWDSERQLLLVDPRASIPYQEEAIAALQELRENDRVFPRGHVSAPPVDVPGVRGSGEIDDAEPAPRSPGTPRPDSRRRVAELEAFLETGRRDGDPTGPTTPGDPAARTPDPAGLVSLAVALLGDASVPREVGARVAEAAEAAKAGDGLEARRLLLEALDRLDPPPARTDEPIGVPTRASPLAAAMPAHPRAGAAGAAEGGGTGADGSGVEAGGPFVFATLRYESGNWDSAPLVPQNLIHALAQYTDLPVEPEGVVVDLSSPEIFGYPVLYLTGHLPVRFSEAEARNLRAYVERGGFVFMDDHNHDVDGAFHRSATAELARIFGDDALQPLPVDHELYSAFFLFEDGPPTTSHELSGWGDGLIHPELHAILLDGRIGVLYSNKDYSSEWNYHAVNKRFLAVDNTRFGVNLLIYALTR
jgi:hypothetical protein